MDINNPNIGKDLVVITQLVVVAPAGRAPLEGNNFLLDAIGFQNLVEHLHLIKAGLVEYKDFCYLVEKDLWTWQKSSPSGQWCRVALLLVSVAS